MVKAEKFRTTKELIQEMNGEEKALATLAGLPVVTVLMDAPETAVSVVEDVADGLGRAWGSLFGD
jgi:hypothetical protein